MPRVSAGLSHTAVITNSGTLLMAGRNNEGQLGLGDFVTRYIAGQSGTTVTSVVCGGNHTIRRLSNGTYQGTGSNSSGQLGTTSSVGGGFATWTPVFGSLNSSQITHVGGGQWHTCVVHANMVFGFGWNAYGQLGTGNTTNSSTGAVMSGIDGFTVRASKVECGALWTCVLLTNGSVRTCGNNGSGQLGNGQTNQNAVLTPVQIITGNLSLGGGFGAVDISCGGNAFGAALMSDGTIRTWGNNLHGNLGDGTTTNRLTPINPGFTGVSKVVCCNGHMIVLFGNGTIRSVGYNFYGQLGNGTRTTSVFQATTSLQVIQTIPNNSVLEIATCLADYTVILLNNGTVKTCGRNLDGCLGDGTATTGPFPEYTTAGAVNNNRHTPVFFLQQPNAFKSSGSISFDTDIAPYFGGSRPHSLSEYYGLASGLPTSGTIRFSDFYGKHA